MEQTRHEMVVSPRKILYVSVYIYNITNYVVYISIYIYIYTYHFLEIHTHNIHIFIARNIDILMDGWKDRLIDRKIDR